MASLAHIEDDSFSRSILKRDPCYGIRHRSECFVNKMSEAEI